MSASRSGVLVLLALLVLGLAAGVRSQETKAVSYATDVEPIFLERCSKCHGGDEAKAQLTLTEGVGYQQLVGHSSTQVPELQRVAPANPDSSYLWQKLQHSATVGKGMPRTLFGATKLPDEQLALIQRWITDGARP